MSSLSQQGPRFIQGVQFYTQQQTARNWSRNSLSFQQNTIETEIIPLQRHDEEENHVFKESVITKIGRLVSFQEDKCKSYTILSDPYGSSRQQTMLMDTEAFAKGIEITFDEILEKLNSVLGSK